METIGKYEIVRRMGTGALGEVYEGRDPATGVRCVVKTCSTDDPAVRERFLAAAQAARALVHPAVATVLDAGREAGKPFLVEEFLSGEALDRRLERGAPLPTQQSVGMLFQVAQALSAASALGIVHRDLRLANVRLLSDGRAKVQGFGVAELARTAAGASRAGEAPIETAFVSPEQIRGQEPDARSDQFAFGVMAYELLSGRRPFGGEHAADFMVQVLSAEPISLRDRSPDCPPEMARIVARCMEKEPDRRFATAADLVSAMAPLVEVVADGGRQVTRVLQPSELKPESPSPEGKRSEARARIAQHLMRGELAPAEAALREAERLWGGAGAYGDLRQRLRDLRDVERREQVKSLLDSARRFLGDADFDLAQRACVEALTFDPAEPEAHRLLAEIRKGLEHQRHEDEMEASRSIARFAVAELLASPDPPPRDPPARQVSGEHVPGALAAASSAAAPSSAAALDDTVAGLVPPPPPPEMSTSWPELSSGQHLPPVEPPPPANPPRSAVEQPAGAPAVAAALAGRIEALLAAGKLDEARGAVEELKGLVHGDETVRREHARLSSALLDAYHAQRLLRPSGARPLPMTGTFEATGSRALVTAPKPAPVAAATPAPVPTSPPAAGQAAPSAPVPLPASAPKTGRGRWLLVAGLAALALLAIAAGGFWVLSHRAPSPPAVPPSVAPRMAHLAMPANALAGLFVLVDGGAPLPLAGGLSRDLAPGDHVLTFVAPGAQPQELHIQLKAGEQRTQSTPFLVPLAPAAPEATPAPVPAETAKAKKKKPLPAVVEPARPVEQVAAPAPAAPRPVQRGDLVEAGPGVTPPKTVKMQGARYPDRAKREKREATIGVLVLVDENGRISDLKVQDADPYGVGFDDAALAAVRQAVFEPATKDGVAVKMWKLVRVGFRLK